MANSGIDTLSNLPEHILLRILSFLPPETAVTTTPVLSKRWQYLWTLVPNLDFDESRSHPDSVFPCYQGRGFAKFVNKVLFRRRGLSIRRFRLKCLPSHDHSDDLDSWVSLALARNVQELDLDLDLECYHPLPRSFSFHCTQQSCKTLVVLKLRWILISGRLDKVSFPVLKILHLQLPNKVTSDEFKIKFLPSGFPVLEELVIKNYAFRIFNVEIYLPKLRSLAIALNCRYGLARIDCPTLTHLVVDGSECQLENLLSLVEAKINLGRFSRNFEDEIYGRSVLDVVKAISNVRILNLSPLTMKEIYIASSYSSFRGDDIRVFHNLVRVELPFIGYAWEILILMLQKFENLECLTLCYQGISRPGVDMELMLQMNVPNCLTSNLSTFSFREFEGTNDEIKVIRYILENSLVLKNMAIHFSSSISSTDRHSIGTKLCKCPRGSEGCELEFLPLEEEDEAVNLKK